MKKRRRWSVIRQHFFVLVTLLGCLAPWVTPRLFQSPATTAPPQPQENVEERAPPAVQQAGRLGNVCVIQPEQPEPSELRRGIAKRTKQKK